MKIVKTVRVFDTQLSNDSRNSSAIVVSGSRIKVTPVEPGKVTYSATIQAEFLLEPK